jgi:hypothetical protein
VQAVFGHRRRFYTAAVVTIVGFRTEYREGTSAQALIEPLQELARRAMKLARRVISPMSITRGCDPRPTQPASAGRLFPLSSAPESSVISSPPRSPVFGLVRGAFLSLSIAVDLAAHRID